MDEFSHQLDGWVEEGYAMSEISLKFGSVGPSLK